MAWQLWGKPLLLLQLCNLPLPKENGKGDTRQILKRK